MRLGTTQGWLARGIGLVLAGSLTLAAMTAWRMPEGRGELGADVMVASSPSGELAVDPVGPFLTATGMAPGEAPHEGAIAVRNQTGTTLTLRLAASSSSPELAELLRVEVRTDRQLFRGPLQGLVRGDADPFRLEAGTERTLSFRVWLPAGAEGYSGRLTEVGLAVETAGSGG